MIVLNTNLQGDPKGTTQYTNFNFNSMARFGEHVLCASESGLFLFDGPGSDGPTPVPAYFQTLKTDFGMKNQKRMRYVYLSFYATSDIILTVYDDGGRSHSVTIIISAAGEYARRVSIPKTLKGRYWTFRVANSTQGGDFSINEIQILPIARSHGHEGN